MWKNVAFVEFVEPYIYLKIRGNYIDDKLSYEEEDYDDVEFSFEMADYYDDGLTYEAQFPDKDPETINLLLASYWTKGTSFPASEQPVFFSHDLCHRYFFQ